MTVTILELSDYVCRWPMGDRLFCGAETCTTPYHGGSKQGPYCAEHRAASVSSWAPEKATAYVLKGTGLEKTPAA